MTETLIFSHPACLEHDPGSGHPESPARLQTLLEIFPAYETAPLASEAQILLAHSPVLLQEINQLAPAQGLAQIDTDTLMSPASLEAAFRGSGAACSGIDRLMQKSPQHVFCATRPPGHHATRNTAMGFCLFNHIAIAACYAQQEYQLKNIVIVDFDVHHGNGTQDIAKGQNGLFYISTHQSPFYPGSGLESENIPGNILNIPLPAGTGDEAYRDIFSSKILPVLEDFKPELLLVSAGFDAHNADPLAMFNLNENTYRWLGEELGRLAREYSQSRLLSVLEGGYNTAALQASVKAYLQGVESALL